MKINDKSLLFKQEIEKFQQKITFQTETATFTQNQQILSYIDLIRQGLEIDCHKFEKPEHTLNKKLCRNSGPNYF